MTAVDIRSLREHVGETVTVRGWVTTTRSSGKIAFVVVRDGSGYVQGVLSKKEIPESTWTAFGSLTQEASVALTGQVREEPRSPGGYELAVQTLEVLGASPEYPITPKEHGTTFLFEHRHLWLRSRRQAAVAGVRHEVIQAIRDFFYQRDFTLVVNCTTPAQFPPPPGHRTASASQRGDQRHRAGTGHRGCQRQRPPGRRPDLRHRPG
jgi:asparaginyl-tRNA synthetase